MAIEDGYIQCVLCDQMIAEEHPRLIHNGKIICSECCVDLIEPIYHLGGTGLLQVVIFRKCLESSFSRKRKRQVSSYQKVFNSLLHKYNFQCVYCGEGDEKKLTIDHIKPKKLGGSDNISNLQILCKSCNSSKGAKWQPKLTGNPNEK